VDLRIQANGVGIVGWGIDVFNKDCLINGLAMGNIKTLIIYYQIISSTSRKFEISK
jgi:hypothetical protein